jgi:hypothetical protein
MEMPAAGTKSDSMPTELTELHDLEGRKEDRKRNDAETPFELSAHFPCDVYSTLVVVPSYR